MRRISDLLSEVSEESRKIVIREMNDALKDYDTDWTQFWVLKDYEEIVKGIMEKKQTWYLECAAHEVEIKRINPKMVKLSVTELKDWEMEEFVNVPKPFKRLARNYVNVMVHISPESKRTIMK